MVRRPSASGVLLLVALMFAAAPWSAGAGPELPQVDADALMVQVRAQGEQLRAEAERLIKEEGAEKAIERLRAEAKADKAVAFQRMNLAAVVAVLAQQDETAAAILADETPLATDAELPLALARHAIVIDSGQTKARAASAGDLAAQGWTAESLEGKLQRSAEILAALEVLAPDSRDVARLLSTIGLVYWDRRDLGATLDYYQRSLAIEERLAPDSLEVARSLDMIGIVHSNRGDLSAALDYHQRSLAIAERLAPDSLDVGHCLVNIGHVYSDRGDLAGALECCERSLAIFERLAPNSLDVARALENIGRICWLRGDLDAGLAYCQRSLAIEERLAPDSLDVAAFLSNIGLFYFGRGDDDAALQYYQRSLAIEERLAPDSLDLAGFLSNIGNVCRVRGDLEAALQYYRRSLAIEEHLAPDSVNVALSLENIANVCQDRGEADAALDYYQRSLAILGRLVPDSLEVAHSLNGIGVVYWTRGDLSAALDYYRRSLAIRERLAPGSVDVAESLNNIGHVYHARGDLDAALGYDERAVGCLERARGKSGALEQARSQFVAQYTNMYQGLIRVLVAMGRVEEAAATAERMRARGLLEMIAERSVGTGGAPGLRAKQEALDTRRDGLYSELQGGSGKAPNENRAREIAAELQRIALDQETLAREVRQSDPRYAALQYPEPMTSAQLREALDPATVALLYVVGDQATWLFCLGPGTDTSAYEIEVTGDALGQKVEFLLGLIAGRQDVTGPARALGRLLLGPAEKELAGAKRLLILPDGPLWMLPFQALLVHEKTVLCDRLPLHYAPSGTVFVESRRLRTGSPTGKGLLAYGDPDFSVRLGEAGYGASLPIRAASFGAVRATPKGTGFNRLPYSGLEARSIATIFSPEAEVREGSMATEEGVRRESPGHQVVHIASHCLLDPKSPLDSALVLSIPQEPEPGNDGFLKAWEVFGLDLGGCDLVTLSACETARGERLSGEGVIGLTRAFMYAGAASVLCSQWKVADDSTAALMVRFYTHYRDGDSKDVALQKAMREIRTGTLDDGSPLKLPAELGKWRPQWAYPYHWAPFVLMGEYLQTATKR